MKLLNKTIIITGAGDGIGKTTALLLASEGANVVVTDINEKNGIKTVEEIQRNKGNAFFVKHDISKEEDWKHVIERSVDKYETVDVLFNNAGIFMIKPLINTSLEEWNQIMSINVAGTFLGMKYTLPIMIKNNSGSIINACSTAGLIGSSGVSLYGASKGAIRVMSKTAAMEYATNNIRVNAIFPGFVNTQMIQQRAKIDKTNQKDQSSKIPLGRLGEPQDIAKTVLFLASEDSSYITGAEIIIDGGKSVGNFR